jgi:ATP-binding cassette subfamily B protein
MKSFHLIKPYFSKNWSRILIGLVSLIAVDILQLIIPRIIKWAVDDLTALRIDPFQLFRYGIYIAVIAFFIGLFRYVWRVCLLGLSRKVEEALRNRLLEHLQKLSCTYFDQTKTGDLMAHATNDIMHVRMATGMGIVAITDALFLGTAAFAFMAYINAELTLYVMIPMPLIVFVARVFSKKMHRRYQEVQASFSDLTEAVRESLSGIRILKAFTREKAASHRLYGISKNYIDKNIKLVQITGSFFPLMLLFSNLSLVAVLFFGGQRTIFQDITPGDFVAFISYLGLITWPMMALGWVTNLVQRGKASLDRIDKILQTLPEISDHPKAVTLKRCKGEISFDKVRFSYMPYRNSILYDLKDAQFHLKPGETLGIVGPPGSGKSTLLHLIPRLYDVTEGAIRIDGVDIRRIYLDDLRGRISLVSQEPFLFAGTVRDNIVLAKQNISESQLIASAKRAALFETIQEFPKGFETVVGEKGVILSGGQKQRIAIARALVEDTPILLLDDPISQVDMETGQCIINGLTSLSGTRTIIIVSHRLSALRFADRIMVLDRGRIQEIGSHKQLIETNPYYTRTFQLQEIEEAFHAT